MYDELFSVAGKTALVTGGATGLGRSFAEALLKGGARVFIASRKGDVCLKAAEEMQALGPCEGFAGDVSSEEGVTQLIAALQARTDRLDILVNNSGATWGAPFESFPWSAWTKVLAVNVIGLFTLTQKLMPMIEASASRESPSRIVNVGSATATAPIAGNAYSYAASKAGVHHLTRIMAKEFAARNVTVNAIAPGPFLTSMTSYVLSDPAKHEQAGASLPLGRLGSARDVAGTILYLCSPAGAYLTGAILPLDGGLSVEARSDLFLGD